MWHFSSLPPWCWKLWCIIWALRIWEIMWPEGSGRSSLPTLCLRTHTASRRKCSTWKKPVCSTLLEGFCQSILFSEMYRKAIHLLALFVYSAALCRTPCMIAEDPAWCSRPLSGSTTPIGTMNFGLGLLEPVPYLANSPTCFVKAPITICCSLSTPAK